MKNPAVSQLAGEIAEKLRKASSGTKLINIETAANVISAALSEREEKIAELIASSKDVMSYLSVAYGECNPTCTPECKIERFKAALSALGESK